MVHQPNTLSCAWHVTSQLANDGRWPKGTEDPRKIVDNYKYTPLVLAQVSSVTRKSKFSLIVRVY
jgi:hypothetical protein